MSHTWKARGDEQDAWKDDEDLDLFVDPEDGQVYQRGPSGEAIRVDIRLDVNEIRDEVSLFRKASSGHLNMSNVDDLIYQHQRQLVEQKELERERERERAGNLQAKEDELLRLQQEKQAAERAGAERLARLEADRRIEKQRERERERLEKEARDRKEEERKAGNLRTLHMLEQRSIPPEPPKPAPYIPPEPMVMKQDPPTEPEGGVIKDKYSTLTFIACACCAWFLPCKGLERCYVKDFTCGCAHCLTCGWCRCGTLLDCCTAPYLVGDANRKYRNSQKKQFRKASAAKLKQLDKFPTSGALGGVGSALGGDSRVTGSSAMGGSMRPGQGKSSARLGGLNTDGLSGLPSSNPGAASGYQSFGLLSKQNPSSAAVGGMSSGLPLNSSWNPKGGSGTPSAMANATAASGIPGLGANPSSRGTSTELQRPTGLGAMKSSGVGAMRQGSGRNLGLNPGLGALGNSGAPSALSTSNPASSALSSGANLGGNPLSSSVGLPSRAGLGPNLAFQSALSMSQPDAMAAANLGPYAAGGSSANAWAQPPPANTTPVVNQPAFGDPGTGREPARAVSFRVSGSATQPPPTLAMGDHFASSLGSNADPAPSYTAPAPFAGGPSAYDVGYTR